MHFPISGMFSFHTVITLLKYLKIDYLIFTILSQIWSLLHLAFYLSTYSKTELFLNDHHMKWNPYFTSHSISRNVNCTKWVIVYKGRFYWWWLNFLILLYFPVYYFINLGERGPLLTPIVIQLNRLFEK